MTVEGKPSSIEDFSKWCNYYPLFTALSWLNWIPSVGIILVDWYHRTITIIKTTVSTPSIMKANIRLEWPLWFRTIVRVNIDKTRAAGKICVNVGDWVNPLWFIWFLLIYVCSGDYLDPLLSMLFYISNIKLEKGQNWTVFDIMIFYLITVVKRRWMLHSISPIQMVNGIIYVFGSILLLIFLS